MDKKTALLKVVEQCKREYQNGNLKEAGKLWCDIHDLIKGDNVTDDDLKLLHELTDNFTNDEVFGITDYLKEQEYIRLGYYKDTKKNSDKKEIINVEKASDLKKGKLYFTLEEGKIVAIYARYSVPNTKGVDMDFMEYQIDFCKKAAKSLGIPDDKIQVYSDVGYTVKNMDRPALNKLNEDIKANKVGLLIMKEWYRYCDDINKAVDFDEMLMKHKVSNWILEPDPYSRIYLSRDFHEENQKAMEELEKE